MFSFSKQRDLDLIQVVGIISFRVVHGVEKEVKELTKTQMEETKSAEELKAKVSDIVAMAKSRVGIVTNKALAENLRCFDVASSVSTDEGPEDG